MVSNNVQHAVSLYMGWYTSEWRDKLPWSEALRPMVPPEAICSVDIHGHHLCERIPFQSGEPVQNSTEAPLIVVLSRTGNKHHYDLPMKVKDQIWVSIFPSEENPWKIMLVIPYNTLTIWFHRKNWARRGLQAREGEAQQFFLVSIQVSQPVGSLSNRSDASAPALVARSLEPGDWLWWKVQQLPGEINWVLPLAGKLAAKTGTPSPLPSKFRFFFENAMIHWEYLLRLNEIQVNLSRIYHQGKLYLEFL